MGIRLIGIVGGAGDGRRPVVQRLVGAHEFDAQPIIQAVRDMVAAGFGLHIETMGTSEMDEPIEFLGGSTLRQVEATLMHDWGRRLIHSDVWISVWRRRLERSGSESVVVPDLRYPNEAMVIRKLGGVMWRVLNSDSPNEKAGKWARAIPCEYTIDTAGRGSADGEQAMFAAIDAGVAALAR